MNSTPTLSQKLRIWFHRTTHYEYWSSFVFYIPLGLYAAYLVFRYRSFAVITSACPGVRLGGLIGESKAEILEKLNQDYVLDYFLVPNGSDAERTKSYLEKFQTFGFRYPVILKPDVGQRGKGLKLIRTEESALQYLQQNTEPMIVQKYDPGPWEAGVFYYRYPDESRGRIYSITLKEFPKITGDGRNTIGELILRHPRYRYQWKVFRSRLGKDWNQILSPREEKRLAVAGNHSQGTLFLDGSSQISEKLLDAIEKILQPYKEFCFGRFDVFYSQREDLENGKNLRVIELNGISSESTNLYDPKFTVWQAYTILLTQWKILFEVGHQNRKRGFPSATNWEILKALWNYGKEHPGLDFPSD